MPVVTSSCACRSAAWPRAYILHARCASARRISIDRSTRGRRSHVDQDMNRSIGQFIARGCMSVYDTLTRAIEVCTRFKGPLHPPRRPRRPRPRCLARQPLGCSDGPAPKIHRGMSRFSPQWRARARARESTPMSAGAGVGTRARTGGAAAAKAAQPSRPARAVCTSPTAARVRPSARQVWPTLFRSRWVNASPVRPRSRSRSGATFSSVAMTPGRRERGRAPHLEDQRQRELQLGGSFEPQDYRGVDANGGGREFSAEIRGRGPQPR